MFCYKTILFTSATDETNGIVRLNDNGVLGSTNVGHVQRFHIEKFLALELGKQFLTFQTSGLFKIGGDLTSLATSSNVGFGTVTNGTSYLNK
jgi:hypothetical protein